MQIILAVFSIIFILATLATILKIEKWWIRAFDFPYVQFTLLGVLIVIGWMLQSDMGILGISLLALSVTSLVYRLFIIYPYTILSRKSLPDAAGASYDLRILSANVLMSNSDYEGLVRLEKKTSPDVLLLVEVDEHWKEAIHEQIIEDYPYQVLHPLDNTYGMMLYSKLKIEDESVEFLVEDDVPSILCKLRLKDGRWVRFYGLHPRPPAPGENEESTERDAELVIAGMMARKSELPVIVAGDMNDVAWSHTTRLFIRLSGLLDPRMGRGFFNTFNTGNALFRWPLDHIFLSEHFKIVQVRREDHFHSDHFPIMIDVILSSPDTAIDEVEYPDMEDLEESIEKIDKVTA